MIFFLFFSIHEGYIATLITKRDDYLIIKINEIPLMNIKIASVLTSSLFSVDADETGNTLLSECSPTSSAIDRTRAWIGAMSFPTKNKG